jgi:hypothetical protein
MLTKGLFGLLTNNTLTCTVLKLLFLLTIDRQRGFWNGGTLDFTKKRMA